MSSPKFILAINKCEEKFRENHAVVISTFYITKYAMQSQTLKVLILSLTFAVLTYM